MRDLKQFFENPSTPRQKQYEAIRAVVLENLPVETVAKKFGYTVQTIYSLIRDAKNGNLDLCPSIPPGPKKRRTPLRIQQEVLQLRKENLSSVDIREHLHRKGDKVSVRTVERILADFNYPKLPQRTNAQRGLTKAHTLISERSQALNFAFLHSFKIECPVVGIFFFLPYIIESSILEIVKHCQLPQSSVINALKRLSQCYYSS
jgi:transposase